MTPLNLDERPSLTKGLRRRTCRVDALQFVCTLMRPRHHWQTSEPYTSGVWGDLLGLAAFNWTALRPSGEVTISSFIAEFGTRKGKGVRKGKLDAVTKGWVRDTWESLNGKRLVGNLR